MEQDNIVTISGRGIANSSGISLHNKACGKEVINIKDFLIFMKDGLVVVSCVVASSSDEENCYTAEFGLDNLPSAGDKIVLTNKDNNQDRILYVLDADGKLTYIEDDSKESHRLYMAKIVKEIELRRVEADYFEKLKKAGGGFTVLISPDEKPLAINIPDIDFNPYSGLSGDIKDGGSI